MYGVHHFTSLYRRASAAWTAADPDARDVLERAAVVDVQADPELEARNLIGAAVRRELAARSMSGEPDLIRADAEARLRMEDLRDDERALSAAGWLLGWLEGRRKEHDGGG